MAIVRLLMLGLGVLALLAGLLFIGQGLGYVRWPSSSFMIDDYSWSIRGALIALGGALMIWAGRRRR